MVKKQIKEYWMHTSKGIANGCDSDLVYAVVGKEGKHLVAWKLVLKPDGTLRHPAYEQYNAVIQFEDKDKVFIESGDNGSKPTASFRPDSFYQKITDKEQALRVLTLKRKERDEK